MGSGCSRSENNLSEKNQSIEITIAKVTFDFFFPLQSKKTVLYFSAGEIDQ